MKNIFHHAFNAYKTDIEPRLNDLTLRGMQCSRRLFEIQLSHRRVSAAYIEGDNVAVTVEGEAAYVLNFDTGEGAAGVFEDLLRRQEVQLRVVPIDRSRQGVRDATFSVLRLRGRFPPPPSMPTTKLSQM